MISTAQARELVATGRLREAGAALSELLRRAPGDADAMQLLGVVQFQSGFQREGLKWAQRATAADPGNAEAWNSLGLMRHLMGNDEAALEAFARATEAQPGLEDAWKNLGFVLLSM